MSSVSEPDLLPGPDPDDLAPRHDVPAGGRSGYLNVEGRQVHYLEWGHRGLSPVLCLHGGGQTAYMFEELGAALGAKHHVVAPDLPGHGDSDPITGFDMTRQALARAIEPVCDAFGFDRSVIVGASLGGITAVTLAAARPELISGIVLIDIGTRLEDEGVRKIVTFLRAHESFASLEEAAAEIARYLPHRKQVRPESLTRNLRQRPDGRWVWKHSLGRRWRAYQEAAAGSGTDEPDPSDWRTMMAGMEGEAAGLACPVLVLRGAFSDVLSDEGAGEVAALIPDSRLETVRNAGHLAAGDNPDSTINLISRFLTEIRW
jgi:pimeloyl-ACP methyl ester carboxylesterase